MITIETVNLIIHNLNLYANEDEDLNEYFEEDGVEYCFTPEGETYYFDAEADDWVLFEEVEEDVESDDSED